MSIFTDAERLLSTTLGDVYAERIRIVPQAASRVVVGTPDRSRPAYIVRGTLLLDNEYDTPSGAGTRNGTTPGAMVATNTLTVELTEIPNTARLPKPGDYVEAIDRPAVPVLRVDGVDPLGTTDYRFTLSPVSE